MGKNVFAFNAKPQVTREMLERAEASEACLMDIALEEIQTVIEVSAETDLRSGEEAMKLKRIKDNAASTVSLMTKLGLYTAAKRGTLTRDQHVAGNYPTDEIKAAERIVELARERMRK